ncbi:protein kinase domain-containing protein [Crocosphaera sp. XPORK-15E]|uniref:protein kinase domain-containing protein n=1 Tax=Crocosphaera sp. XPORK-15E TaxID=3110247 RepID=UPI002B20811C|nr:protein kinase [Crocosphaera sp. XPORK-15E]MEA5534401.1 protein kinase [Crocosphaera sp. XPORK-15E]
MTETWPPGKLLEGGNYSIERELGRGGFGITYLARTQRGDRVVIKTLNQETIPAHLFDKFCQDFYEEGKRLEKCKDHPHIVKVLGLITESQLPCLVMEYVPGQTLHDWVANRGILLETDALNYIRQIGSALQWVHQQNILHRDIKPDNIMIREQRNEAILIDFGIAREFNVNQTKPMTAFASGGYTALEQSFPIFGKAGEQIDVYGLAATVYYCVTSNAPPEARNRKDKIETLIEPKNFNPAISNELNQAIIQGLAIFPKARPQTIEKWLNLLPNFSSIKPTKIQKTNIITPQQPLNKSGVILLSSLITLLLVIIAFLSFLLVKKPAEIGQNTPVPFVKTPLIKSQYSGYGIKLTYPSTWKFTANEPNNFIKDFVKFTPNKSLSKFDFEPRIIMELYQETKPLDEINQDNIEQISISLPSAKISATNAITLAGNPAYQIVYAGKEDNLDIQKKLITIKNREKVYLITYEAAIKEYSKFEETALEIIESLEFIP